MAQRTPRKPPPAVRATVDIEGLGAQGDGLATLNGERVFVPYTLPGERVTAEFRGARGRMIDVIEPRADRAAPQCPHFGACGGCALQHLTDEAYKAWKRDRVVQAFAREGLSVEIGEFVPCQPQSRRRASFAVRRVKGGWRVGFQAARSHDVIELEACSVLGPQVFAARAAITALCQALPGKVRKATAFVTETRSGIDLDLRCESDWSPSLADSVELAEIGGRFQLARLSVNGEMISAFRSPTVQFEDIEVQPPQGAFLQATKGGEDALIRLVRAGVGEAKRVADLYSGCGTFTLPLAKSANVFAVEGDPALLEALDRAARRDERLRSVKTEHRDLSRRPLLAQELEAFDAVVFDPPRAGAGAQAVEMAKSGVSRLVAVSCNPTTMASDLRVLIEGGYRLDPIAIVDQFQYAAHIECVARLIRD